jgi:hypothetical protein
VATGGCGGIEALGSGYSAGNGRPYFSRIRVVVAPSERTST